MRSLAGVVRALSGEIEFSVITRDRDWGAGEPYSGIETSRWLDMGPTRVWYVPRMYSIPELVRLMRSQRYDLLYLNSLFSPLYSVLPMVCNWAGLLPEVPILIAPRGELAHAALALKPRRKRSYLAVAQRLSLYRNVWFHAATPEEGQRIVQVLGINPQSILVAPNTTDPNEAFSPAVLPPRTASRKPGPLRIVFLSRLSPIKNLDFLIEALRGVRTPVECHVYGPVREDSYWRKCLRLADTLPAHVRLAFHGAVPHEAVGSIFAQHDVFFFPTQTESFGHVIAESLRVGTPVVTSDCTPWVSDGSRALQTIPITDRRPWTDAIEHWCGLGADELAASRNAATEYLARRLAASDAIRASRMLFERIRESTTTPAVDRGRDSAGA
ncbi:MAG: hypothetical protein RI988_3193 [Pseudomonadota bacterium]